MLLALAPAPLPAQEESAGSRWAVRLGLSRDAFTGASQDTTTFPGSSVEVVPTPRLAVEVGLGRRVGPWEFGLSGGYAGGGLRASTEALFVDERTGGVDRYRASLMVRRDVARLEAAALSVTMGFLADLWRVSAMGDRTSLGVRGGAALAIPLSQGLALENTALVSVGGGPFNKSDLPPDAKVSPMWTWSFGMAVRVRP
jgi:hypothetical protein